MRRSLTVSMLVLGSLYATAAFAEPGETWDITSRSVGNGMGVPDVTVTVCLAPGDAKNPQRFIQQDDTCKMTDLKTVGKKTTWKMKCGSGDNEMTGNGEVTYAGNSFQGQTRLSGRSEGEPVDMKMSYQGKKIGAACDTSAPPVVKGMEGMEGMEGMGDIMSMAKSQMTAAMAEQCEVANHTAMDLISPRFFGPNAICAGKEKAACKVIAKAVAKDPAVFGRLSKFEDTSELGIAKTCNIDLAATAKTICSKVNSDNYREYVDACPQEAKAFEKEQTRGSAPAGGTGSGGGVSNMIDNAIKIKSLFGF